MNVPLKIAYRDLEKDPWLEGLIEAEAAKLERFCDYLSSCRVIVERPQKYQQSGSPYRIRLDMTVPPSHEIIVKREPGKGDRHEALETVIRDAFGAARRRLQKLVAKQRGEVKRHPVEEDAAVVRVLFRKEGYGFLRTSDGRDIYFHKNSVLHRGFEQIKIGCGVRFVEETGDKGPQASTVEIVHPPPTQ